MCLCIAKTELLREYTHLRQLRITLTNGTVIRVEKSLVGVDIWGGTVDEVKLVAERIEKYKEWLKGGPRPE